MMALPALHQPNWSGLISTGLCLPQQGDAYTMRIGDKITVTGYGSPLRSSTWCNQCQSGYSR